MEPAKNFQDLVLWQKVHSFVLATYKATSFFPKEELYGLTSPFRRAAISIAANISEGFAKRGKADKVRYLNIAQGSLQECKYYLILAGDLKYCVTDELSLLLEVVSKLLNAYSRAVKNSIKS